MTGRSRVSQRARGVGFPIARHSNVNAVPTGTFMVCENEAIRAGALVFVVCVMRAVGSPLN